MHVSINGRHLLPNATIRVVWAVAPRALDIPPPSLSKHIRICSMRQVPIFLAQGNILAIDKVNMQPGSSWILLGVRELLDGRSHIGILHLPTMPLSEYF